MFNYDGGGRGKGANALLYINGESMVEGRIERTQAMLLPTDETADIGIDLATPVVKKISSKQKSRLIGNISKVQIEIQS